MDTWRLLAEGMLFLIPCSVTDIRSRRIPAWLLLVAAVASTVLSGYRVYRGEIQWLWIAAGLMPGVLMVLMSFVSGRKIGSGDGIVLAVIGILTGCRKATAVLMISLLLSFPVSAILLLQKRTGRSTKIPFVPFITGGFLLTVLMDI